MELKEIVEDEKFNETDDSSHRNLNTFWVWILRLFAVGLVFFHLYTAYKGSFILQTSYQFIVALSLVFVIYPIKKTQKEYKLGLPIYDILFFILAIIVNLYYVFHFERIFYELGSLNPTNTDIFLGLVLLILIFESSRRLIGIIFPTLGLIALIYAVYGQHFGSVFQHSGYSWDQVISTMYLGQTGIFQGQLLGVSADVIGIFILFGALLLVTGGGQMFIKIAVALAGKMTGGPAKIAVIASSMFGSVSGSTAANTATTGVFTIPLMKKNGYSNHFAGGIEAAASCGGQILPPIMGATAFILAEVTQISYPVVAASAIIPAILFFFGIWVSVHFEAKRLNLKPLENKDMESLKDVLFRFESLTLFVPLILLISLLIYGYTPTLSAFWAVVGSVTLFIGQMIFQKKLLLGIKKLIDGAVEGTKTITLIAVIIGIAQIIATVISMTGIGNKLSSLITSLGQTSLILTLILGMITTIILGMGVPTVAAYMLAASVIASAFVSLGIDLLSAHMFILYFAILSAITPPVALAAFIAGGIAKAHWLKTALAACRIGLAGFIIPFIFIYQPAILGQGTIMEVGISVLSALIAILALGASTIGFFIIRTGWLARGILLGAALSLITPGIISKTIGLILILIIIIFQYLVKIDKLKGLKQPTSNI